MPRAHVAKKLVQRGHGLIAEHRREFRASPAARRQALVGARAISARQGARENARNHVGKSSRNSRCDSARVYACGSRDWSLHYKVSVRAFRGFLELIEMKAH